MRWGYGNLDYVEATEDEVVFYNTDVKWIGPNGKSRKSIQYSEISSVNVVSVGGLLPMITIEIRFRGGEKPYTMSHTPFPGNDHRKTLEAAHEFKKYVETRAKAAKQTNSASVVYAKTVPIQRSTVQTQKADTYTKQSKQNSTASPVEAILKLKELLDNGLITADEFAEMKEQLLNRSKPQRKPQVNVQKKRITKDDFIIYDGSEKWNYISRYGADEAYFEFCENDVDYEAMRGIDVTLTFEEVLDIINDLEAFINTEYDYSEDVFYSFSKSIAHFNTELDILRECDKSIMMALTTEPTYDYFIIFYFGKDDYIRLVGYLTQPKPNLEDGDNEE